MHKICFSECHLNQSNQKYLITKSELVVFLLRKVLHSFYPRHGDKHRNRPEIEKVKKTINELT